MRGRMSSASSGLRWVTGKSGRKLSVFIDSMKINGGFGTCVMASSRSSAALIVPCVRMKFMLRMSSR
jgi:hypothetical protein